MQNSNSPPRYREVHLPCPSHKNVRKLVQGLPRTTSQRIQVLPNTQLHHNLPCFKGDLGCHPMSQVFDRDVFTLSQVAPPWVNLLGQYVEWVEEVFSERCRVG